MKQPLFRTGIGQDSHVLLEAKPGEKLHLAGVAFECGLTFEANSDGDVILHALCNALSTAIGGGSLSGIADRLCEQGERDSEAYVCEFAALVREKGYQVANLSVSVEALQPKLEKYGKLMKNSLAKILDSPPEMIGVAFTSGEGLTICGQGKGIACLASVLLEQNK